MKHSLNLFIVLSCVCLFACGCKSSEPYSHKTTEAMLTSGWHELKAGNSFKLVAPPDFRYEQAQGIDSFVGYFISPQIKLSFDYGRYSGHIRYPENLKANDFKNENTTIDGVKAIIQTYSKNADEQHFYYIGIYFPSVPGLGQNRLAISTKVKNINDSELVRNIFETIRFL